MKHTKNTKQHEISLRSGAFGSENSSKATSEVEKKKIWRSDLNGRERWRHYGLRAERRGILALL